jgi:hypothetical protein
MVTADRNNLGHLGLLRHWTYSSHYVILRHLGQLGHPSHLGHLSHLSKISDLNPLNPSPLNPAPTDSLSGAFITEMDPMDPGPSEGCYADDSLNPLHLESSLETNYTNQTPPWE